MMDHINKILEIHCLIYNKDFLYYKDKINSILYKNYNDTIDPFIFEFYNIYKNYDIYFSKFNLIKENSNENFKKIKEKENFFIKINDLIDINFWHDFMSISLLNGVIRQTYLENQNSQSGSVNIINLVDYICEDYLKFIDFLYVFNKIEKSSKDFDEFYIKKFILRLIHTLVKKKTLITEKISIYDDEKKEIKYSIFIKIDNLNKPKNLFMVFNVSIEEASLKERGNIRIIGFYHYTTNIKLVSEKIFRDETVLLDKILLNIKRTAKQKFYIDKYMLEVVKNRISQIRKSSIEDTLKKIKYLNLLKKKTIEEIDKYEEPSNEMKRISMKISKIQKELSLNIDFWIFDNLYEFVKELDKPLYFIPYIDFRGRSYTYSSISPKSNWIFRFIYNFGVSYQKEFSDSIIYKIDTKIKEEMIKVGVYKDWGVLWWVFLSIGFLFKKNIKKSDKIKPEEFIQEGIKSYDIYKNKIISIFDILENSKSVECIYYIKIIEDHLKNNIVKRYLIKDTTASIYQHLGKLLIFKDEESLNLTNLGKINEWRDTYSPIIKKAKEKNNLEYIEEYFNRDTLKKLLFTVNYNIGRKKAFKNFCEEIGYIDDKESFKKISSTFASIFKWLKSEEALREFYVNSIDKLNECLITKQVFQLEDIKINLVYYKPIKKEICIFIEKKRITMANYKKSKEIDEDKTTTANVPNVVHALDGLYARRIMNIFFEKKKDICVNHDAFYVTYYETDLLIIAARESIKINEKFQEIKFTTQKTKNKRTNIETFFIVI